MTEAGIAQRGGARLRGAESRMRSGMQEGDWREWMAE